MGRECPARFPGRHRPGSIWLSVSVPALVPEPAPVPVPARTCALLAQVNNIDFAKMEAQVVEGLEAGNTALKHIQEEMSLEHVEEVMDDLADNLEWSDVRGVGVDPGVSSVVRVNVCRALSCWGFSVWRPLASVVIVAGARAGHPRVFNHRR